MLAVSIRQKIFARLRTRKMVDNPASPNPEKRHLRQILLTGRQNIPTDKRRAFDAAICECIERTCREQKITTVAGYHAVKGEPDIGPALLALHHLGISVHLPVVDIQTSGQMEFRRWSPDTSLTTNRFGIAEPVGTEILQAGDLDLALTPLLGYSDEGHRIGMGGGYYDRYFSSLDDGSSTIRCGVAYSLQNLEISDPDPWDIALHAVINEHGWFTFNR